MSTSTVDHTHACRGCDGTIECEVPEEECEFLSAFDGYCEVCDISKPDTYDGFIVDRPMHGYDVSLNAKFLGHIYDRDEADALLKGEMEKQGYYPTCWYVDDHGGHEAIKWEGI